LDTTDTELKELINASHQYNYEKCSEDEEEDDEDDIFETV